MTTKTDAYRRELKELDYLVTDTGLENEVEVRSIDPNFLNFLGSIVFDKANELKGRVVVTRRGQRTVAIVNFQ